MARTAKELMEMKSADKFEDAFISFVKEAKK